MSNLPPRKRKTARTSLRVIAGKLRIPMKVKRR